MKKTYTKISLLNKGINTSMFIILALFFLSTKGISQVIFTQTTDADFNQGYLDNVAVSGNSVSLSASATGVSNWLSTNSLPQALSGHKTARWKNYVFLSGGYNGSAYTSAVYRATMQAGGNSTWTALTELPVALRNHAMVASAEHLYVIGGRTDGNPFNTVYYAKINTDGSIGAWTESAVHLPVPLWGHTASYANGYIYIVGGTSSSSENTALNTVYYAKIININGEIGAMTSTSTLPAALNGHSMVSYGNKLIVMGGYNNSGVKQSSVYYSSLDINGSCSSWSTATALALAISNHASTCYNGLITVIGGETGGGLSDQVHYANIDNLPALAWTTSADLLYEACKDGVAYPYNGEVVFAGGVNSSASPIHNTRYTNVTLTSNKVKKGTFISYPFYQLGEERDITSLTYTITYSAVYNNYNLYYRLAGSDQLWGNWVDMGQANPALIGQHKQYIQYMIRYDGTNDANIVLQDASVNISGYTQLSGNLNSMASLTLANSPYWATGNISFTSGTHTIEAGVQIYFSENTGLEIGQANMQFNGTSSQPILLTSYTAGQGLWNGVLFNTNSDNGVASSMNYVIIENAGNGTWNANLYCDNTNEPNISHCTFREAVGNGLRLNVSDLSIDNSEFSSNTESGCYMQNSTPSFSACEFLTNSFAGIQLVDQLSDPNFTNCVLNFNKYGIYYPSPNYSFPVLTGISSYNNTVSGIAIAGGDITSDQVWPYNELGYAVLGTVKIVKINSKVRLTIEPGNTIYFDTLAQLQVGQYVYYNQNYGGELYAVGNADSIITFTSVNGSPGGWEGIYFHYNSDEFGSVSELNYCTIQNASTSNVRIEGSLQPRIDNCTINNSLQYGVWVLDPNSVPVITNTNTTVYVTGGVQSIHKRWYNYGGEYILLTDLIIAKQNDKVRLTIEPGITVKIDTSANIQVGQYVYFNQNYGGELYAEGNVDSIIVFTSRNGLTGGWDGIYFHYNSDEFGSTSSLDYCTITKGKNYNIMCDNSVEPRIDHCTVNETDGYDIYAANPNSVPHITRTVSTVYVGGGTQTIDRTWYNYGGNYILLADMIIAKQNNKVRLTIQPGITVKADTSAMIQVAQYVYFNQQHGGELYAEGKADSLITFSSRNGLKGGWEGIFFHYNSDEFTSTSSLKYCVIEKGLDFNVKCEGTVQPVIDHCTINNTDGYDIYAADPNSVPNTTATTSTIYVAGGVQNTNMTWYNFGGEYIVLGDLIVAFQNSYRTLTIQPGITVKFDVGASLQIGQYVYFNQLYGGEIKAEGTFDNLIQFRAWDNSPGGWDGIYFHEFADNYGGRSSLKYCIVDGASSNNIYFDATNNVDLEHISILNSMQSGIRLNNSSPYIKLCQIINNDSIGVILTGSSQPVIGDTLGLGCDIYGNGDFGIYNATANLIHAKNNFWNTMDYGAISTAIYDYYDLSSYGIVEFIAPSGSSYFTNYPPEPFGLISLANNTATQDQTPSFTWQVPVEPNGDPVSYYFYYTDDVTWATNVITSPLLSISSYTIPATLTGGKWYYWKVKATDGYLSRYSSDTWTFAVSLPPSVPVPIIPSNGTVMQEDDYLVWLLSTDPDAGDYVSHYHLQVDDDADFSSPEIDQNGITEAGESSSIAMQINDLTGYLSLENKKYFWRVSAIDGFGIESNFSSGTNYFIFRLDVELKVFLEGPFSGSSMTTTLNTNAIIPLVQPYMQPPWNYMFYEAVPSIPNSSVVDWVLVELRDATTAANATGSTMIMQKAAFLLSDGIIVDLDGVSPLNFDVPFVNNLYVVVWHRNHLAIMSANPLVPVAGKYALDFTSSAGQVYGGSTGHKEISAGKWGMVSGDGNADGLVSNTDKNNVWKVQVGLSGYLAGDFNLNGQVDNNDKALKWKPNSGKGSQVPD